MATKTKQTTPDTLTAKQIEVAKKVFDDAAMSGWKTREQFQEFIIPMFTVAGIVIVELKKQLAALNRERVVGIWRARIKKQTGMELTLDEIDRAKKSANSVFSEYTSNGGKAKTRTPQQPGANVAPQVLPNGTEPGENDDQDDATDPQATPPQGTAHSFAAEQTAKDIIVRVSSIQATMLQFQQSGEMPANVIAFLGDMAEQLNKLHEQAATLVATLA